jgi:hypothetical protein
MRETQSDCVRGGTQIYIVFDIWNFEETNNLKVKTEVNHCA